MDPVQTPVESSKEEVKETMKNPFLVIPKIISGLGKQGSTNDLRVLRQLSTEFHFELSRRYFDLLDKTITCDLDKMLDGDGDKEICAPVELPHIYRHLRFQHFEWIDFQLPSRWEHLYFLQQLGPFITTIDFGRSGSESDLRNGEDFHYIQLVKMFSEHNLKVLRMEFYKDYHPSQGTIMEQILEVVNPYNITVEVTLVIIDFVGMDKIENLLQRYSNFGAELRIALKTPEVIRRLTEIVTVKHPGRIELVLLQLSLNDLQFPVQSEQIVAKCVQALLPEVQMLEINQKSRTNPWNLLSLPTLDKQSKFPELTYLTLEKYDGPLLFLQNFPNLVAFQLSDWSISSVFCDEEKSEEENLKAIFENLKKLSHLFMIGARFALGDSRFERLEDGGNLNTYLRSLLPEDCLVTIEPPED